MKDLFRLVLCCLVLYSCDDEQNCSGVLNQERRIPVYSLEGEKLDSATLMFHGVCTEIEHVLFEKFSLRFENKHVNHRLNLENKYFFRTKEVVLIGSTGSHIENVEKKFAIDTVVNLKAPRFKRFSVNATYNGLNWFSEVMETTPLDSVRTGMTGVLVKQKSRGVVSNCIFVFDMNFNIVQLRVFKMNLDNLYL